MTHQPNRREWPSGRRTPPPIRLRDTQAFLWGLTWGSLLGMLTTVVTAAYIIKWSVFVSELCHKVLP
jgi:hypothetical protein